MTVVEAGSEAALRLELDALRRACVEVRRYPLAIVHVCRLCGAEADVSGGYELQYEHRRKCRLYRVAVTVNAHHE